jgi:hypothetical protein
MYYLSFIAHIGANKYFVESCACFHNLRIFDKTLVLTIIVLLILKVWKVFFSLAKHIMGHFEGRGPLEDSPEMSHYLFFRSEKNNKEQFQNQRYIGIFISLYIYSSESSIKFERRKKVKNRHNVSNIRKCGRLYFKI